MVVDLLAPQNKKVQLMSLCLILDFLMYGPLPHLPVEDKLGFPVKAGFDLILEILEHKAFPCFQINCLGWSCV